MLAFVYSLFLLLAGGGSSGGGFSEFWNTYFNYPGFELWKFLNLAIFVFILIYFVKKPLTEAFKSKRESIRAELIKAEEEKQAALAQLTTAEAKLVGVDSEKERILKEAKEEIGAEKQRLIAQAEAEAKKLREQAAGEVSRIGQVARLQLRRFAVDESLRKAEDKLKASVDAAADAKLVKSGIQAIGGLN
ncbi:MAG: F0F1 ATP synthase subunit B family protein [Blastocatellia bacterium]